MTPTVIESPYGSLPSGERALPGRVSLHVLYLDACLADSLARGEAPFASHKLYPGVLDDSNPAERRRGMEAGFVIGDLMKLRAVYCDYGITGGMLEGVARARLAGQKVVYRLIGRPGTDYAEPPEGMSP